MVIAMRRLLLCFACLHVFGYGSTNAPSWWKPGMPPYELPPALTAEFTMGGQIPVAKMYVDDSNGGMGTHYQADREEIKHMIAHFDRMRESQRIDERWTWLFQALAAYPVEGKAVAVFGSLEPAVEAILLAHGANNVTTVEYNMLTYDHPQLFQVQPEALLGKTALFDVAVSLSSFDHDGLGRYGDPVDPDGDLKAMHSVQRLLRGSGTLFLTVPVGPDVIVWNLHRRYGPTRLPELLKGWRVLEQFGWDSAKLSTKASWRRSYEPVHVLRPLPRTENAEPSGTGASVSEGTSAEL